MTFLDFFSGIGGFRLGMEMAGHKCLGHCEIDKFADKSYRAIHEVRSDEWYAADIKRVRADELPKTDCWCFGFPCQDISLGGKKIGFKGNRSSLFFAVTRLVKDINEENRPKYLFAENVKNFLSVNGGYDFLKALIELDEIGYDAEWQLINSRGAGVPQNRERVYLIGHLRESSTRKVFPIQQDIVPTPAPRAEGFKIINMTKQGFDYAGENDSINFAFPGSNTRRGRVGRGYFQTIDTQCTQAVMDGGRWRQITPREAWRLQGIPDWAFDKAAAVNDEKHLYKQAGNGVTVNVIYEIAKRL